MSSAPPVADHELLYRRVRHEDYRRQSDGTPLVLSVAFAVFRKLCTRLARLANARPWELPPPSG